MQVATLLLKVLRQHSKQTARLTWKVGFVYTDMFQNLHHRLPSGEQLIIVGLRASALLYRRRRSQCTGD